MSYGRTMRVLRRRGQYMSVGRFLAQQRRKYEPKRFHDDSTVSDFLRGPAIVGQTPAAPRLEDYDRTPATSFPDGEP